MATKKVVKVTRKINARCLECNGSGEMPDGDGGITECEQCGGTGEDAPPVTK